ncbi:recombination protein RecR [Catalinimonas alkaloidigena]|uniref:recombination mediator RecR n=1 Tax=Catalinimonas alkaloidigena TaxID=1075417 RepID=UPI002405681E|nr:recombination mediator RecR [Catalinimonas alkaloidigena]MDF9794788.1 recombination protein RecR [Catalinimonas alkaloidigena]
MEYPSKLIEDAVNEIAKLPGIGKKTALRLALHMLREEEDFTKSLSEAMVNLRTKTQYCKSCHNISDSEICGICANERRDHSIICVVETVTDLIAIENTSQYRGLYHVLGGVISPIEGIGPGDLHLQSVINRVISPESEVKEIILALSSTMEGDTTAFFITKKLKDHPVKITSLARGVPIGSELEYTDEITLGRSILGRKAYEQS